MSNIKNAKNKVHKKEKNTIKNVLTLIVKNDIIDNTDAIYLKNIFFKIKLVKDKT